MHGEQWTPSNNSSGKKARRQWYISNCDEEEYGMGNVKQTSIEYACFVEEGCFFVLKQDVVVFIVISNWSMIGFPSKKR